MNESRNLSHMVSLFSGIGGFELAFKQIGVSTTLMCEIDSIAQKVLSTRFPNIPIADNICTLRKIPSGTNILCAGFPCQDLSSVGIKKGMSGTRSSLVKEVFRIIREQQVEWVVFENVSFMLSLNGGETIRAIVDELEDLGYKWAYRSIDSISFVPQHRCRVFIVASLHHNPCDVLLSDSESEKIGRVNHEQFLSPLGFYWTEGKNALGLVQDALPTLKAGSTIGIASPPAIVFPDGEVSMPDIRDAERLQGFPADWTLPAEEVAKSSYRWRLVGNAVTVDTVAWIAKKILHPKSYDYTKDKPLLTTAKWPKSAWGEKGERYISSSSLYPNTENRISLINFLKFPRKPLSLRATTGFYNRLKMGRMQYPTYFQTAILNHINKLQ